METHTVSEAAVGAIFAAQQLIALKLKKNTFDFINGRAISGFNENKSAIDKSGSSKRPCQLFEN